MSVYTPLSREDIQTFLHDFALPALVSFDEVQAGIENTNYRLHLQDGSIWFLTLFEHLTSSQLPYFMQLLDHLGQRGCAVANPQKLRDSRLFDHLKDKPAALFPCKSGTHPQAINAAQAHAAGAALARLHKAGKDFAHVRENDRGYRWVQSIRNSGLVHLNKHDDQLMAAEISWLSHALQNWTQLPRGICHGDLFPDNVLFDGEKISALLDFYNASTDVFAYDLAITLNAWCALNEELSAAMLAGYQTERVLDLAELEAILPCRRLAALRFWLSRLIAVEHQKSASATTFKDPQEMCRLLLALQNYSSTNKP
ncbi:MAG: homoserine kinase [Oceanospirillaceae bacterium]|nr:homoserine kinase [Oceanospirillaceae bacterium]MCP5351332.1 homoserine kinase [Oceanospirillaceae bacterium]